MEFNQIVLSKEELSALKELRDANCKKESIKVAPENKDIFDRLAHFDLVVVRYSSEAATGDRVSFPLPKAAFITERGLDYLTYLEGKSKERRRDWRREIALLIIGSLITLFFEHFHDLLNLARTFLKAIGE